MGHVPTTWPNSPKCKDLPSRVLFWRFSGVNILWLALRSMGPECVPVAVEGAWVVGSARGAVLVLHGADMPFFSAP
jgi:hypothetical protein